MRSRDARPGDAEIGDLTEVGGGRLVVQVRGSDARLGPIRECWTDAARRAVKLVQDRSEPCDRFIIAQDRNAAARADRTRITRREFR